METNNNSKPSFFTYLIVMGSTLLATLFLQKKAKDKGVELPSIGSLVVLMIILGVILNVLFIVGAIIFKIVSVIINLF